MRTHSVRDAHSVKTLCIASAIAVASMSMACGDSADDASSTNNGGSGGSSNGGGGAGTDTATSTDTGTGTGTATTGGMGPGGGGMGGGGMGGGGMGPGGGGMGGMGPGGGGMGGMGPECNTMSDCLNNNVCDVATTTCVPSQCNPNLVQPGGCVGIDPVCLEQTFNSGFGVCYEGCVPFETACPAGLECQNGLFSQDAGICLQAGTANLGEPCSPNVSGPNDEWTVTTGCISGLECLQDELMNWNCFNQCDYFGAPSCPGPEVCYLGGHCLLPIGGVFDTVPAEQACPGAAGGEPCGLLNDGYAGACNDLGDGAGMVCRPNCSFDNPCPGTLSFCADVFAAPLEGDVGACAL